MPEEYVAFVLLTCEWLWVSQLGWLCMEPYKVMSSRSWKWLLDSICELARVYIACKHYHSWSWQPCRIGGIRYGSIGLSIFIAAPHPVVDAQKTYLLFLSKFPTRKCIITVGSRSKARVERGCRIMSLRISRWLWRVSDITSYRRSERATWGLAMAGEDSIPPQPPQPPPHPTPPLASSRGQNREKESYEIRNHLPALIECMSLSVFGFAITYSTKCKLATNGNCMIKVGYCRSACSGLLVTGICLSALTCAFDFTNPSDRTVDGWSLRLWRISDRSRLGRHSSSLHRFKVNGDLFT